MLSIKNKVILACAGSGKTYGICNDARRSSNNTKKILMVSYTHKGVDSLRREYSKQNCGVVDNNVNIYTWFQFVLRELIKPYQKSFLNDINKIETIDFSSMYGIDYSKKNTTKYFFNVLYDVKANRASELALFLNQVSNDAVIKRLQEIYSSIYIDELQDLAGKDIELLELLFLSSIKIYCVGDYKQSTLKTHNAKSNKKKSGVYVFDYLETLKNSYKLEIIRSNCSRRFVQDIADFANMIYLNDPITSIFDAEEPYKGVYQILIKDVIEYIGLFKPNILRYDIKTSTLGYHATNFGVSKGMTMERVLIFPNKPLNNFLSNPAVNKLSSPDKYYVGVTRARYSLAFVVDKFKKSNSFVEDIIKLNGSTINVMKFNKK